jgi:hypothetical protein
MTESERAEVMAMNELMNQFKEQLHTVELDPRARWHAGAKRILERELAGIPTEIAMEIAGSLLRELAPRLIQCLLEGQVTDGWMVHLELEIRNALRYERQHGRLKPVSPTSEVERCMPILAAAGYDRWPIEIDSILALLTHGETGERIVEVAVRHVRTSTRTIGRLELANVLKPSTQTNITARRPGPSAGSNWLMYSNPARKRI